MSSKVSVIIPVYNAQNTIGNILDKLIAQDYKSIEIITVNDGSKDGSLKVLQKFAKKDKRVIVVDQKNAGASAARNAGIKKAKGEFITFIDADDDIDERLIVELANGAKDGADFVMCGMVLNGKEIVAPSVKVSGDNEITEYVLKSFLTKNLLYGPYCKLFRRDLIVKNHVAFPVDIKYGEDTIFVLQYLGVTKGMAVVGKALYFYEMSPSGLASKNNAVRVFRRARTDALNRFMDDSWSVRNFVLYTILRLRWLLAYLKSKSRAVGGYEG